MIAFVVGFLSFLLAGFGLGGGVLLIPLITVLFSFSQTEAQYVALIAYMPAAIGVIISSLKEKSFESNKVIRLIPFGVSGAVCGALLAMNINTVFLRKIYNVFLILFGAYMCLSVLCSFKKTQKRIFRLK